MPEGDVQRIASAGGALVRQWGRVQAADIDGLATSTVVYRQTDDPGAVGPGALWLDTTTPGPPWRVLIRDASDTGWTDLLAAYIAAAGINLTARPGGLGESGEQALLQGGSGDAGAMDGAAVGAGGGVPGSPGRAFIYTGGSTGARGEIPTAQGDDSILWAPPGRWEVAMATGIMDPPDPVTSSSGDDWLYGFVAD